MDCIKVMTWSPISQAEGKLLNWGADSCWPDTTHNLKLMCWLVKSGINGFHEWNPRLYLIHDYHLMVLSWVHWYWEHILIIIQSCQEAYCYMLRKHCCSPIWVTEEWNLLFSFTQWLPNVHLQGSRTALRSRHRYRVGIRVFYITGSRCLIHFVAS